jgi:hypothetical protein
MAPAIKTYEGVYSIPRWAVLRERHGDGVESLRCVGIKAACLWVGMDRRCRLRGTARDEQSQRERAESHGRGYGSATTNSPAPSLALSAGSAATASGLVA